MTGFRIVDPGGNRLWIGQVGEPAYPGNSVCRVGVRAPADGRRHAGMPAAAWRNIPMLMSTCLAGGAGVCVPGEAIAKRTWSPPTEGAVTDACEQHRGKNDVETACTDEEDRQRYSVSRRIPEDNGTGD